MMGETAMRVNVLVFSILSVVSLCFVLFNRISETPLPLVCLNKVDFIALDEIRLAANGGITSGISDAPTSSIELEEFKALVNQKQATIVDARPEAFYQFGHVPGAISIPRDDFEKAYTRNRTRMEADRSALIVVYCSDESCEDSEAVRRALRKLGHSQTVIFKGGWQEWKSAGLPEIVSSFRVPKNPVIVCLENAHTAQIARVAVVDFK